MRSKETEADYRYFREPDLLPVRIDEPWLTEILKDLPELPLDRRQRFIDQYSLPEYDADILTAERSLSDYFEIGCPGLCWRPETCIQLADERRSSYDQRSQHYSLESLNLPRLIWHQ